MLKIIRRIISCAIAAFDSVIIGFEKFSKFLKLKLLHESTAQKLGIWAVSIREDSPTFWEKCAAVNKDEEFHGIFDKFSIAFDYRTGCRYVDLLKLEAVLISDDFIKRCALNEIPADLAFNLRKLVETQKGTNNHSGCSCVTNIDEFSSESLEIKSNGSKPEA